jgi:hypothetical protein
VADTKAENRDFTPPARNPPEQQGDSQSKLISGLLIVVAIIAVAGVAMILPAETSTPSQETPDGTVKLYWSNVDSADFDEAREYTTPGFEQRVEGDGSAVVREVDISVDEIEILSESTDEATVQAVVTFRDRGERMTFHDEYELINQNGDWYIESLDSDISD